MFNCIYTRNIIHTVIVFTCGFILPIGEVLAGS